MVINIQDKQSQHKAMSAWDDVLVIDDQLSSEEKILKSSVRSYCQEKLLPRIIEDNRNENFSREIFNEMGELGILGSYLHGYGCAGVVVAWDLHDRQAAGGWRGAREKV